MKALAQALLEAHVPSQPSGHPHAPTPLQLWRRQYEKRNAPPSRKRRDSPRVVQNAWFALAPDRAPLSIAAGELGR